MAVPSFVGVGAFASGTGALTVGLPSGWQQNDLLLLCVESANQAVTTPSGWAIAPNSPQGLGDAGVAGSTCISVFYKWAGSSESSVSVADSGNHTTAVVAAFRDVNSTTPFHATAGNVSSSSGTSPELWCAPVTTTISDCLLVFACANDQDGNTTNLCGVNNAGYLSGLTKRFDQTSNVGTGGGVLLYTCDFPSAGAISGPDQFSEWVTFSAGADQGNSSTLTIALAPLDISPHATLDVTEAPDAISATGSSSISGSASPQESTDTLSASGSVPISASASITEANDTLSSGPANHAALDVSEANDTISAAGSSQVRAASSTSEASDTASAAGSVVVGGTVSITEASDTLGATASMAISGSSATTEQADGLSATGAVAISASLSIQEANDTLESTSAFIASLSITEANDTAASGGSVAINGGLSKPESLAGQYVPSIPPFSASDAASSRRFGHSVSLNAAGNVLVVGEAQSVPGDVYTYDLVDDAWVQRGAPLTVGLTGYKFFGQSVSLSADGSVLAVGCLDWDGAFYAQGAVYIFDRSGSTWVQRGSALTAPDAADWARFGSGVSLSADGLALAVGAQGRNNDTGAVYTFDRSGSTWVQRGTAVTADAVSGDLFGASVNLSSDGSVLAVGASGKTGGAGAVYIFDRSGNTWVQRGSALAASDASANAYFGASVSLVADALAVGSSGWTGALEAQGAVYTFDRSGDSWVQRGDVLVERDAAAFAEYGIAVSLDAAGAAMVVGSPFWSGSVSSAGGVYSYRIDFGDTLSATGTTVVLAAAAVTESSDTLSSIGGAIVAASVSPTEANDTLAATGSPRVSAVLAITEANDTLVTSYGLNVTEENDALQATGGVIAAGTAVLSELADTAAATGSVEILANAAMVESEDGLSSEGSLVGGAAALLVEDDDTLSADGSSSILAGVSVLESDDTLRANDGDPIIPYGSGALNTAYVESKWEFIDLMRRICEKELGIVIEDLTDEELVEIARLVVGLYEKERL